MSAFDIWVELHVEKYSANRITGISIEKSSILNNFSIDFRFLDAEILQFYVVSRHPSGFFGHLATKMSSRSIF